MRFLLDTMVVSEAARPIPHPGVIAWLEAQNVDDFAISVVTLGEIARGVARMRESKRRSALQEWLTSGLSALFDRRILPIDEQVSLAWGDLTAQGDAIGRPLPVTDGLLLATALVHRLTMVTRNVSDMDGRGVAVINPYEG